MWLPKVYCTFVHLEVTSLVEHCRVRLVFKGVFRVASRQYTLIFFVLVRGESFAAGYSLFRALPSGQTCFSPDETSLRCIPSGQTRFSPDGRTLRPAYQFHFGSQCATESVYRHLSAKVERKKSHFGKTPLTECTLRRPPCQSELADAPPLSGQVTRPTSSSF